MSHWQPEGAEWYPLRKEGRNAALGLLSVALEGVREADHYHTRFTTAHEGKERSSIEHVFVFHIDRRRGERNQPAQLGMAFSRGERGESSLRPKHTKS